jgi:hypothetical protein
MLRLALAIAGPLIGSAPSQPLPRLDILRSLCVTSPIESSGALLRLELIDGERAPRHGAGAVEWSQLGCVRVALALAGVTPRAGTVMTDGASWNQGAISAMREALHHDPANTTAARTLAVLTLGQPRPRDVPAIVTALADAHAHGVMVREVLQGCDELAVRIHRDSIARACAEDGLRLGTDSTWHNIQLAHIASRSADTASAVAYFVAAAAAARSADDRADMGWQLRWFVTPAEYTAWDSLPDADRGSWARDRLAERDVLDGQPPGSRIVEDFRRLDFVVQHFQMAIAPMLERKFMAGLSGMNDYGMPAPPGLEQAGGSFQSGLGSYRRWQINIDDRGIVYMRLGAPAQRYYWGYGFARELWVYEIDHVRHLLHFQDELHNGNVEATRLVLGVQDPFFCGIDPLRCSGLDLGTIYAQDQQSLQLGTTRDDNHVRDTSAILVSGRLFRLWDPETLQPLSVATFALPSLVLMGAAHDSVPLTLRIWNARLGREIDTTVLVGAPPGAVLSDDASLVGAIKANWQSGGRVWSMTARRDSAVGKVSAVIAGDLRTGDVSLSDLIVGDSAQHDMVALGDGVVTLGPLGAFRATHTLSLFYQMLSTVDDSDIQSTVTVFRIQPLGRPDQVLLTLGFNQIRIAKGLTTIRRELNLSALPPGPYRLTVEHHRPRPAASASAPTDPLTVPRSTTFVLY